MSEIKVTREQALAFLDALAGYKEDFSFKSPEVVKCLEKMLVGEYPMAEEARIILTSTPPEYELQRYAYESWASKLRRFVAYLRAVADALDPDLVACDKEGDTT